MSQVHRAPPSSTQGRPGSPSEHVGWGLGAEAGPREALS